MKDYIYYIKKLPEYIRYNLIDKWKFVYFEMELNDSMFTMPKSDMSLTIRIAKKNDISKIKKDIYPYLTATEANDKRYIERIGDDDFKCFIALKEEMIVHYFLVFEKAINSPLAQTPFKKSSIGNEDAYLGTAFTLPEARGMWIVPFSISSILIYLRDTVKSKKTYVLVHENTPGAVDFYKMLGFKEVDNTR